MEAPAHLAWAVLSNWENHGQWVPLTRVWVAKGKGGVGTEFVGRTGIGPFYFDDPMEVTLLVPPSGHHSGLCEIKKTGKFVLGYAGFTVEPLTANTCRVTWREDIEIAPTWLTRPFEAILAFVAKQAFLGVLKKVDRGIQRGLY